MSVSITAPMLGIPNTRRNLEVGVGKGEDRNRGETGLRYLSSHLKFNLLSIFLLREKWSDFGGHKSF